GGWRGSNAGAERQSRNLGASFARLSQKTGSASVERRFRALLDSRFVDLPEHLRHAISLMRAHDVPVSWTDLLRDIRNWSHPDRPVQREWARTYWGESARAERRAGSADEPDNRGDDSDEEDS
ncbi:MAG TPA: type I-E CRISPR-associated protein Cse2/CasB, partial [Dehalococcoidia bacterium]|nr:type I-E CRISPR-associated protein Cse2/CasB [Dehalococcoidia bacterium]